MIHMCILLACGTLLCVFVDCSVILDSGYILGCTPVYRQAIYHFQVFNISVSVEDRAFRSHGGVARSLGCSLGDVGGCHSSWGYLCI